MHEFALAEAVMASAAKAAEEEGFREVSVIRLRIGESQQIDRETFEFVLREVSRSQRRIVKNASIEIETEPAVLRCRACGHAWPFVEALKALNEEQREALHFIPEVAHTCVVCPCCQSPDFEFVKGRGISIDAIEGE